MGAGCDSKISRFAGDQALPHERKKNEGRAERRWRHNAQRFRQRFMRSNYADTPAKSFTNIYGDEDTAATSKNTFLGAGWLDGGACHRVRTDPSELKSV